MPGISKTKPDRVWHQIYDVLSPGISIQVNNRIYPIRNWGLFNHHLCRIS